MNNKSANQALNPLPLGIKLISAYNLFGAIFCLIIGALGVAASNVLSSIIFLSLGVFLCGVTVGILKLRAWARTLHIAFYSIAILTDFFALLANTSVGNIIVQGISMVIAGLILNYLAKKKTFFVQKEMKHA